MNHKDRFFATIHYPKVDRLASWLGLSVPLAEAALMKHFRVNSIDELRLILADDIYPIEVPYFYPPSNHIACVFNFAKKIIWISPMSARSQLRDFLKIT